MSTGDSAPNFDFLSDAASDESPGWKPPSSVIVRDAPAMATSNDEPVNSDFPEPDESPAKSARPERTPKPSSRMPLRKSRRGTDEKTADPPPTDEIASSSDVEPPQEAQPAGRDVSRSTGRGRGGRKPRNVGGAVADASGRSAKTGGPVLEGTPAIVLMCYAATMTLVALWGLYELRAGGSHQLESLPDVPPVSADEFRYYEESAALPAGHTLPLGKAAQYGYVRVEPLRVTREPVRLQHYSGDVDLRAPGGGETVLKLWLRLTNESDDQKIAPLDRRLVYERRLSADDVVLANQFVVPAAKKGSDDPNVLMYELSPDGEWDVTGQPLPTLEPGQSIETCLVAGPANLDKLSGPCLWRILLRKGHHDVTGRGVLTLIEVPFDANRLVAG